MKTICTIVIILLLSSSSVGAQASWLDHSFSEDGYLLATFMEGFHCTADQVIVQPDGKILVGVNVSLPGGETYVVVTRYLTDSVIRAVDIQAALSDILIYPNPAQQQAQLEYNLQESTALAINLYDMQGRLVQNLLAPTIKGAGAQRETLYLNNGLAAGTYLLSIETEGWKKQMKVVIRP